jgi:hypothetical protein
MTRDFDVRCNNTPKLTRHFFRPKTTSVTTAQLTTIIMFTNVRCISQNKKTRAQMRINSSRNSFFTRDMKRMPEDVIYDGVEANKHQVSLPNRKHDTGLVNILLPLHFDDSTVCIKNTYDTSKSKY